MNKTILIITSLCLILAPADTLAKKKKQNKKTTIEQTLKSSVEIDRNTGTNARTFVLDNPQVQLSGEWTIKKLRGKNVTTSDRAYLNFDINNSRLYGSNGCNVINGAFSLSGTNISLNNIITTRQTCVNNSTSRNIMKALAEVSNLTITEENGIEFLSLRNKGNHELLRLKRQNFDFANGAWKVEEISGSPISQTEMRLVIDTDQLSIHGDTGCNIINGVISIDSDKYHAIQFEDIISTRNPCSNISSETALLVALEEAVSARLDRKGLLQLIDNKGNVVVQLSRLKIKK